KSRIIAVEYDVLDIEGTLVAEMGQFLTVHDSDDRVERLEDLVNDNQGKIKQDIWEVNNLVERKAEELTNELIQRIGDVNADIESLLQRANGVDGTLTTIHTEIDDINGRLSSTITQVTNMDGVVSEHTTTLQQHYDAIMARAEK